MTTQIITKQELLKQWQGHRTLTRRTIEKFPEQALFKHHVEGMRPFAAMVEELLAIAVPGLMDIVNKETTKFNDKLTHSTKKELLAAWDMATPVINDLFIQLPEERFHEKFNLFGEYEFPIVENILYFIDNEIHHRAQGFVYLRQLGIEPPFFWERY